MNLAEPSPVVPGVRPTGVPGWVHARPRHADSFRDFYSRLFGWDWVTVAGSIPGEHRAIALSHRRPVASSSTGPQAADTNGNTLHAVPTHWSICFISSDVRHTASQILQAGGSTICHDSVTRNPDELSAVEAWDPNGGAFSVLSVASIPKNTAGAGPSTVTWSELLTDEVLLSANFYHDVFGLRDGTLEPHAVLSAAKDASSAEYRTLTKDDQSWAGIVTASQRVQKNTADSATPFTPQWVPWFGVTNLRDTVQCAEELGARVVSAPRELMPGLSLCVLAGIEGELFALHEEDFGPGPDATAAAIEH